MLLALSDTSWIRCFHTAPICLILLLFHELSLVLGNAVPTERCSDRYVHYAITRCNQHLADISSMILREDSDNFTDVCRCFTEYVQCIEPNVHGCRSMLLKPYRTNCDIYTQQPYWCAVPDTSHLPSTKLDISHYESPKPVLDGSQFPKIKWPSEDEILRRDFKGFYNKGDSLRQKTNIVVLIPVILLCLNLLHIL